MMMKSTFVGVLATCTAVTTALGTTAGFAAHADSFATGLHAGINQLRQACGAVPEDPRLTAAAQRHANDMLRTNTHSHTGSDGSSPRGRITDAGYGPLGSSGEIVYWGSGLGATESSALNWWMGSPGHRSTILNCTFTAAGFATARQGMRMTAVVDFAGP
ncbi:MAG: CAP domain-containing protein [Actinomycetota bacterium]|nr:CAP domain-containing protein [Actinomycetota bacterium]